MLTISEHDGTMGPRMADPSARRGLPRARRLIGALAIVSAVFNLGSVAPAQAATLQELRLALGVATSGLRSAQEARVRAVDALEDAEYALQAAHTQVNQAAAELWMLVAPTSATDVALIERLSAGVDAARQQIVLAEVDIARARRYVREVRAVVDAAEAQQAQASASARQHQPARAASTIACPVATLSAIYADFGAPRPGGPHTGIDIPAPTGTAAQASWYARVVETPLGGWMGKGVILEDGAGNRWLYAHLDSIAVLPGEIVRRGQAIGRVGSTGNSTGSHLHFEIHAAGTGPIDPYPLVSAACGASDPLGPRGRVAQESSTPEAGSS